MAGMCFVDLSSPVCLGVPNAGNKSFDEQVHMYGISLHKTLVATSHTSNCMCFVNSSEFRLFSS